DPEIATVGLQEAEATAQGRRTRVGRVPFAAIGRALTTGEYDGFVKLIADADSKVLLGATIVGPDASDLISELTLAIEMGATRADVLAAGLEVIEVERGGEATYHGPGQLVGYPILKLPDRLEVKRLVTDLEEVLLRTCADFGIDATREGPERGVWVGGNKIA